MTGRRLLLAAFGVALVVATSAAGAPTWDAPVPISTGTRALGPHLVVNASGEGLVVWDQELGADCPTQPASLSCIHVVTAVARARGSQAWQTPIEISRPGVGATPRAAIDANGNGAIAWIHDIGRDRVLQATYRHGSSGTWPEPNDISEPTLEITSHHVALDAAGDAVAVWAERRMHVFDAMAAMRTSATGAWSSAVRLSSFDWRVASGPELALTSAGRATVVWIDNHDTVWVTHGDTSSGVWTARAALSGSSGPRKRGVKIAANSADDTAVVWARGDPNDSRAVVEAVFKLDDGAWTQAADVGRVAARNANDIQIAMDESGNVLVAWIDMEGRLQTAALLKGDGWKRSVIAAPSAGLSLPRVAIDAHGNAVVVWTTGDGGVVQAAISPGASDEWQLLAGTSVSGPGALDPGVAMDASGNAVAVWNQRSSERVVVESADLIAGGPVLSNLRVPKKGTMLNRLAFSVAATPWVAPLASSPKWNFGDGTSGKGSRVRHRYRRAGSYLVAVSASDTRGGVTTLMRRVRVVKRA